MENSIVYLLAGVPLDSKQSNTLSWVNQQAQINYFLSRRIGECVGSYQRKDTFVRYDGQFDDVANCNYVMYQNALQDNKWYFSFVTDIIYINDSRTDLHIKTDVIQTYYFDVFFNRSFFEREHPETDLFGENTVPENVELGPYTNRYGIFTNNTWTRASDGANVTIPMAMHVIVGTNVDLRNGNPIYGSVQTGTYSGIEYFGYRFPEQMDILTTILDSINGMGKIDGIKTMFMVPSVFVREMGDGLVTSTGDAATATCKFPTTIAGYTPKNKKLFCYPFNFIYATNKQGQNNVYKYELFHNTTPDAWGIFTAEAAVNEGSKVILSPRNYEGGNTSWDNAISLPAWVQCSFSSNTFDAWFAQNGASWTLGTVTAGVTAIASLATYNAAGAISGFTGVFNSLMQLNNQSIAPPSIQGNSGNISTLQAFGENWFELTQRCITAEYAEIIDNYFEMYGYKVNRVGLMQRRSRPQWNYIKTIVLNITSNTSGDGIPMQAIEEIKDIHNNGITYWHNPANVGNYSLNNHNG